jgi:hypothetical protein
VVRYDIYGPDAMLANKMESNGEAGKINISDTTRAIVEDQDPDDNFFYEHNKKIVAKAVNREHESYFLFEHEAKRRLEVLLNAKA